MASASSKSYRRRFRFGLRAILILTAMFSVYIGLHVQRSQRQSKVVSWIRKNGGEAYYRFQFDNNVNSFRTDRPPPVPTWVLNVVNIDYFSDVFGVSFLDRLADRDLRPLAKLKRLRGLVLNDTNVTDLTPLAGLNRLKSLYLDGCEVSDLSPLADLPSLENLNLNRSQVVDLSPLANLDNLQSLSFSETSVRSLLPLAGLSHIKVLDFDNTPVSDLTPIANLANPKELDIRSTEVRDLKPLCGLGQLEWLGIDDVDVDQLPHLKCLPNLKTLRLSGSPSRQKINRIQSEIPNCKVSN
jgi:Leucine-rich repeat (LRR) protein